MSVAASIVEYAMALARAGTTAALALAIGTAEDAADRVGCYADLTASNEKLGLVVGGVTGPTFNRTGAQVIAAGLIVQDSTFVIADQADATKTIAFQAGTQSSGFQLTIDVGAQAANRTLSVPVLTANATLMVLSETQTVTGAKTFSAITTVSNTTSASSSIVGALVVGNGVAATSVAIGGGAINAGESLTLSKAAGPTLSVNSTATNSVLLAGGINSVTLTQVYFATTNGAPAGSSMFTWSSPALAVGNNTTAGYNGLNGPSGANHGYYIQSAGVNRWEIYRNGAESGSDAGANLFFTAKTDAGATIDVPINITRAAGGFISLARPLGITTGTASSALILAGGTVTTSLPTLTATQTWNAGGVTFTGWKLNVTDTASAAASLLLDLQVGSTSRFSVNKTGAVALAIVTATTVAVDTVLTIGNNSSGTPAAGYGSRLALNLKSSTTADQNALQVDTTWVVATHASRTARAVFSVYDFTAARECLCIETSGTAPMIGFLGAAAVARPSLAAATGTATRTTFDTTTVTTQQLAERVKALIDDQRAYGLEG